MKRLAEVLLAWTLLSEMLGPGIGRGVSRDDTPMRQEPQGYQFKQENRQEYENWQEKKQRQRSRNNLLFEQFFQREMKNL